MATSNYATFKRVPYNKDKRDKNGRVVNNPYQYKSSNGKMFMLAPQSMITLPEGNAFIVMRKHSKGKGNDIITWVYGYSNTPNKTQNGKTRRVYFVARLHNTFGKPKLATPYWHSYDQYAMKQLFNDIPYNAGAQYVDKDGKWHEYNQKSLTGKQIVARKIRKQENYQRALDKAYGTKEQRRAWVQAQRNRSNRPDQFTRS